ncbi:MAG: hypothetical protein U9Q21_00510 [Candidatus Auribacterota bacterium]|nr:hypothetical protein [Candidatus Auribacterota bacterium]
MSSRFMRVYKKVDIEEIRSHLIICGDLAASCEKCKEMGFKMDVDKCPSCGTEFKYLAFRNIKQNLPKLQKFSETRPDLIIVDFEDFKRIDSARKAQELFE